MPSNNGCGGDSCRQEKFEAEGDAEKIIINADAKLYAAKTEAEGILVQKTAEAEGQRKMVNAWSGEGADLSLPRS